MNGKYLSQLRKEKKINQQQFAKEMGVSRSTVSMWEINENEPDHNMLKKIANFFDISIDKLLDNNETKETITEEEAELNEYLEELKNRPEMRMLFSKVKGATKKDVEQTVAIIEALRKNNG